MVGKGSFGDHVETGAAGLVEEGFRMSDPGKDGAGPVLDISPGNAVGPGTILPLETDPHARPARPAKGEVAGHVRGGPAGEDEEVGSQDGVQRFAQTSAGRSGQVIGAGGVHEDRVEVPVDSQVLEPVVQYEKIRPLGRQSRRFLPPLAHKDGDPGQVLSEDESLVPHLLPGGTRCDGEGSRGLPAVPPQEDGGPVTQSET
jgi:hypothetical protein